MFNTDEYVEIFTNIMSEGFIVIDKEGIIQVFNNKAKEIFGIDEEYKKSHQRGEIKKGDLVILATNILGKDDGNLTPESLEILGIEDDGLEQGDSLVSISRYNDKNIKADYKFIKEKEDKNILALSKEIRGREIEVVIDYINRNIRVSVDNEEYGMDYINAIGFMVILSEEDLKLKFFQSRGYTARGESIQEILNGKIYRGKGNKGEHFDVIGKNIFEIYKDNEAMEKLLKIAQGENINISDEFNEINGIPTITTLQAVEKDARRIGAALKVEDITELREIVKERDRALTELDKIERELESENILKKLFPKIIGDSDKMIYVKKMAFKASKSNSTTLLLGESGTGKTELAKAIHKNSKIKDKPFIQVNCGSIPKELLEVELFGKEGREEKKGYFELADGGTILLDEIGEIPLTVQAKLLNFLQNKSYYKLGANKPTEVNIRLIAASNISLEDEIEKGNFREDLYYRINVFPIWIPPLRDRMQDLYGLVDYLIPKLTKGLSIGDKSISTEAINTLLNYNWPGNIRELENILERAINLTEGDIILSKHIVIDEKEEYTNITSLKKTLEFWEKKSIENALIFFNKDKKMAMKALDISKTTLYDKINKYNIDD